MKRKTLFTLIAAIVVILVLIIYFSLSKQGLKPSSREPIKVGAILALSSYGALDGKAELRGLQLAINEVNAAGGINGRKIELIIEDNNSDQKTSLSAFQKLQSQKPIAIFGPTYEEFAEVVHPAAKAAKIPLIVSCTGGSEKTLSKFGDYYFTTMKPQDYLVDKVAEYMKSRGFKKLAIISNLNTYSQDNDTLMQEAAKMKGIEVVLLERPRLDQHDFRTILLKAKKLRADAIYAPLADPTIERGNLGKQMKELGINLPLFTDEWSQNSDILKFAEYLDNLFYPYWTRGADFNNFVTKYKEAYGIEPESICAAAGYDAAKVLIEALKQKPRDSETLSQVLHQLSYHSIAYGTFRFDQNGLPIIQTPQTVIKTIRNKQFIETD